MARMIAKSGQSCNPAEIMAAIKIRIGCFGWWCGGVEKVRVHEDIMRTRYAPPASPPLQSFGYRRTTTIPLKQHTRTKRTTHRIITYQKTNKLSKE